MRDAPQARLIEFSSSESPKTPDSPYSHVPCGTAQGFTAENSRVPRGLTPATGTGSSLPFLPVRTCPCGSGEDVEIRLPVSYDQVKRRLAKMPEFVKRARTGKRTESWPDEQAARVAWRHLLLWAEAMLSTVDAGLYTLQEAFFAHTMISAPGGGSMPAVDAVNTMKRLASGGGR